MRNEIWAVVVLCCAMMTLTPSMSRASVCDTFTGDSGNNTILVGVNAGSYQYQNKTYYYSLGKMATCWADQNQIWHYVLNSTGCDIYSTSSEYVSINAGAGDDKVAANSVGHICVAGQTDYLLPFNVPGFDFYMAAKMGTGSDYAYGTENGDTLYSNQYSYSTFDYPADNANDFLCGYDGNDTLIGDKDASNSGYWPMPNPPYAGHEERLNGGLGIDYCYGEDGESVFDWAMVPMPGADPRTDPIGAGGCNTTSAAAEAIPASWPNYAYTMKNEICGTQPPDLWW